MFSNCAQLVHEFLGEIGSYYAAGVTGFDTVLDEPVDALLLRKPGVDLGLFVEL